MADWIKIATNSICLLMAVVYMLTDVMGVFDGMKQAIRNHEDRKDNKPYCME